MIEDQIVTKYVKLEPLLGELYFRINPSDKPYFIKINGKHSGSVSRLDTTQLLPTGDISSKFIIPWSENGWR